MDLLNSYESLSSESSRYDIDAILQSIIKGPPSALTPAGRDKLVYLLLQDIKDSIQCQNGKGRLTTKGEDWSGVIGVEDFGESGGDFGNNIKAKQHLRGKDIEAADDALRCAANAILLVERGRASWVEIKGAAHCVDLLGRTTSTSCIFLCCRILFLCTASPTSVLHRSLLEPMPSLPDRQSGRTNHQDIISIMAKQLDFLLVSILQGLVMSKEALTDLLKFTFNILCHWPRIAVDAETLQSCGNEKEPDANGRTAKDMSVLGERWTRRLDGLLPSLRRVFIGLPPSSPSPLTAPLTHVLHSLLPIPLDETLRPIWFPEFYDLASSGSSTPRAKNTLPNTQAAQAPVILKGAASNSGKEKDGEFRGTLDRALSILTPRLSLSRSSSPVSLLPSKDVTVPEVLQHSLELLDSSLMHYLPGHVDPDDASVRQICILEDVQLDHILTPLVMLVTKFSQLLSNQIGYGNAAGFLFNRGILSSPPPATLAGNTDTANLSVNPITGMIYREQPSEPEMTDEEKEREAEKLFVLFERLEKSGGMENPIKKALHEGKLEKYSERIDPNESDDR
ncbi:hypothetical protein EW145_g2980 [Phellinidium pouzarii]|uniref:Uncharacterized protein n=1 Tax=Phellinidium pouzarii TaxID=167371 RepID=A0A4S4L8R4_9AGAM|nr:hypothetical protein EW145_g2980 [Phellinidium pouzarii]